MIVEQSVYEQKTPQKTINMCFANTSHRDRWFELIRLLVMPYCALSLFLSNCSKGRLGIIAV